MTIYKEGDAVSSKDLKAHDYVDLDFLQKKLIVGMRNPAKKEIKEYNNGQILLKFIKRAHIFFILFKVGALDWSDLAYSISALPDKERNVYRELLAEKPSKKWNLILIDVDTKTVQVNRNFTLCSKFAEELDKALLHQSEHPASEEECTKEIDHVQQKFDPQQLSLSNLVSEMCKIKGLSKIVYKEVIYTDYGWGTNKKIPNWIYTYTHKLNTDEDHGTIAKKFIPDDLVRKGVVKCQYSRKKGKYLYAALYKLKKVRTR